VNIRLKATILVASLFVVLGAAEVLVDRSVLTPSFAELERADARIAMRRITYALDTTLDSLALSATDWGNWADTYRFVADRNRQYVSDNLTTVALKQLNVNALLIVDPEGNIIESRTQELKSGRPLGLDLLRNKSLAPGFPWRAHLREGRPARGMLQTNLGILMLAAAPVLDGNSGGPPRGMVMMGRLLSAAEVAKLGAQAQAQLSLLPRQAGTERERLVEAGELTQVYRSFDDLYGRPIMALRVDVPRQITMRGHTAILYASAYLAGAAVIVLALLVIALNRIVLEPLSRITRHAVAIGENRDLDSRLDLRSEDEVGVLAREFDRMVMRVGETRRQLVDQSFQAGFAELAKGVLHNLGNAMTPVGVRVARLRQRLREAPADDAKQALDELAGARTDARRRADLEEFVHLACKELASTVKAAEEDVEVMSRQTSIIQGVLAEQMRSARNEHVVEAVRLPELLAQSMEIVPDSCRQRLVLKGDDSLRKLGAVRIARTVIRLVLQNVIINAADAIREAGKEKGVLQVAAEIVRDGDLEQLHLHCRDNGVGIAADHLSRVFDKGFSTKSKETNHGIGLHWCANAIAALGGRIWASSEGPGTGTSMHLMIPLDERESVPAAGAA
jgi:sensor domain CHASE-containing protein